MTARLIGSLVQSKQDGLVSTEFKERVELAGLNGFRFVKVWPLPEGESWHENDVAERKKMRKSVEKLSGEAFIIRLRHEGTKASYWHDVAQRILHQFGASPTNKA